MKRVDIYVEADKAEQWAMDRVSGYRMECGGKSVEGARWRYGMTYHRAILRALNDAMGRLNRPCEVHIHSKDAFVLNMVGSSLDRWAAQGFHGADGKLVKNHFEWMKLWELVHRHEHLVVAEPGPYEDLALVMALLKEKAAETMVDGDAATDARSMRT